MAGENSQRAVKYPRDKKQYAIIAGGGSPYSATVYKAKHVIPLTGQEVPVGIKILNMYKIEDIYSFTTELHEAETFDHENLIKVHCSFKIEDRLWIIMSPPGLPVKSIILSSFRRGLPENAVAYVLKETLKALSYMHGKEKLHESINAACIFFDNACRVKLACSSLIYDDHCTNKSSDVVVPSWAIAPEIMAYYRTENSKSTDIWMFGLLALELFYGQIPASDFQEFQFLVSEIENEFGVLGKQGNRKQGILEKFGVHSCFCEQKQRKQRKKIPKLLGEVMAACLSMNPEKRPTTEQLMEYEFFQERFMDHRSLAKLMKKSCKYS